MIEIKTKANVFQFLRILKFWRRKGFEITRIRSGRVVEMKKAV